METRSATAETCWLIGNTLDGILGNKLPSNGQVLRRLFHLTRINGKSIKEAGTTVCHEVTLFWEKARIPTKRPDHIIDKIKKLHETYRGLQKHSERQNPKHVESIKDFENSLDDLFDIAQSDAMKKMTIQKDKDFLQAQRQKGKNHTL